MHRKPLSLIKDVQMIDLLKYVIGVTQKGSLVPGNKNVKVAKEY